jgi:exopolysaccharide biosynthesis WecB/TagA/CpsF family protein
MNQIGIILLKNNLIVQKQLDRALELQDYYAQQSTWKLLGEILVELGEITDQELSLALDWQSNFNEGKQSDVKLRSAPNDQLNRSLGHKSNLRSKVQILNMEIDNVSQTELLQKLNRGVVLTMNVDHLMKLQKDEKFFEIYHSADYKVCDSQVLFYASRFLDKLIRERMSGSDLFPAFYKFHRDNNHIKIFLLGGGEGVAEKAHVGINKKIGRNIIVGSYSPSFGFEKNEQECLDIIDRINQSQATVLAIGVGAPKQEKWIYQHMQALPAVEIFLAIGAAIDFEAGVKQRAPKWVSDLGFEWLHRLMCEPERLWKRYLVDDMPFLWLILKQKLGLYKPPFNFRYYQKNFEFTEKNFKS